MNNRKLERRRFPRINLHAPLRYQILGEAGYDNAISDDIGMGGLSFISDKFTAPATCLILEVNILSRILKAVGRIIWSSHLPHSDRSRFGIEFIEVDPSEKDYLFEYINMFLGNSERKEECQNVS